MSRTSIWTKLKGLLGLGGVGAGIGAVVGGVWFAVAGLLGSAIGPAAVLNAAIVYGSFGFFTTIGLGLFLANARSTRSLDDVSVFRCALIGVAAGALFPLVFNAIMLQSLLPFRMVEQFFPILARLGLFGGVLTAGMVTLAKREHGRLEESDEVPLLP